MAKSDIWMPLFIGDYLADTTRLTTEQHGAYLLLIMDYWRNGPPPNDDGILGSITKLNHKDWKRVKPAVMALFKLEDGVFKHKRIEAELTDAAKRKEKSEQKAKKAAEARWGKVAVEHAVSPTSSNASSNAPSIPQALHEECPSPSPSHSTEKPKSKAEAATATRLPADWQPRQGEIEYCKTERPDLDPARVAENFRDYWIAQPGVKGRKVDWSAVWRTWVRNEKKPFAGTRETDRRQSRHAGFAELDYSEGVRDGRID